MGHSPRSKLKLPASELHVLRVTKGGSSTQSSTAPSRDGALREKALQIREPGPCLHAHGHRENLHDPVA